MLWFGRSACKHCELHAICCGSRCMLSVTKEPQCRRHFCPQTEKFRSPIRNRVKAAESAGKTAAFGNSHCLIMIHAFWVVEQRTLRIPNDQQIQSLDC